MIKYRVTLHFPGVTRPTVIDGVESVIVDRIGRVVEVRFLEQGEFHKRYPFTDPWGDLAVGDLVKVPVGTGKFIIHKPAMVTAVDITRYLNVRRDVTCRLRDEH